MTREEKLEQLERVLQGRALHSSGSLKAFLRFVVHKAVDHQEGQLKEYVIATEVFGRGNDYDSRFDSVVRVQAGRLRAKLQEYYSTEGKDDQILIDLPKGQYIPIFSYAATANSPSSKPEANHPSVAVSESPAQTNPPGRPQVPQTTWLKLSAAGALVLALIFGLLTSSYRAEAIKLKESLKSNLNANANALAEREAVLPLWGALLRSSDPCLVIFSNTLFEGTAEIGMKLFKPLDSPGSGIGSPALQQAAEGAQRRGKMITEHYTGTGEVMGVYFLADFFNRVNHPFRVKRSLLLNWDDMKTENIIVLGSPAENLFLRDLPQKQEFLFRMLKTDQQSNSFGVINTKPKKGEQEIYLPQQEGPSRSQISVDYAVISLLQGLNAENRFLILAGITTLGTQAAAEYVSKPEYIQDLISHLNIAPLGAPPKLPPSYQVVVKVEVKGGVPIHVSYVTHHVL